MKRTRFTDEQIIGILAEHEVGAKCANLAHARVVIAAWAADYNIARPHSALDYQTSADYARALTTAIARPAAREKALRVGRLLNLRRSA